jgi:Domain of unknown function (DUF5664)
VKQRRDVAAETNKVVTGAGAAVSSKRCLYYHLISPHFIKRLAERLTVGGDKYGMVQWRQGINDHLYVQDRLNHFWEHLLAFMEHGNEHDDNLGAMMWGLHALEEVERLCPVVLRRVLGVCNLHGPSATRVHVQEMDRRAAAERLRALANAPAKKRRKPVKKPCGCPGTLAPGVHRASCTVHPEYKRHR